MIKSVSEQNISDSSYIPKATTALMYSCQQGDYHRTNSILKKYPHAIYNRDSTNKNALHYCSECKDVQCADLILATAPELIHTTDEDGFTPLHLAVIAGNVKLINLLLTNKADVSAIDNEKHTIVHWAIVCKEIDVLRIILTAGAPVSTPDIHGGYPIHYAAQMCGLEHDTDCGLQILNILLTHPAIDIHVKDRDGRSPILWGASSGCARAVLALHKAGISVESCDTEGLTALHCAASRGHTDCLDTLLTLCGADVNSVDGNGCTPLHYAVTLGHADATSLLLMHGANFDLADKKNRTAAHCGCAKGQLETIKLLQKYGADLSCKNLFGDIPLHNAVASDRIDLVEWLLEQNDDLVNAKNNNDRTSLHIAALRDNINMCKVLLDSGADINAIYKTGKNVLMTPFDCATHHGFKSTTKYLQMHGGLPFHKLGRKLSSTYENDNSNQNEIIKTSKKTWQKETIRHQNQKNSLEFSESEIEYEFTQSIEKKKFQRKSSQNSQSKKIQKLNQLTQVNNKKKRVQKFFNEPVNLQSITDTDKNETESFDDDGQKISASKAESIESNDQTINDLSDKTLYDNQNDISNMNDDGSLNIQYANVEEVQGFIEAERFPIESESQIENNREESADLIENTEIDIDKQKEMFKEIYENENNEILEEKLKSSEALTVEQDEPQLLESLPDVFSKENTQNNDETDNKYSEETTIHDPETSENINEHIDTNNPTTHKEEDIEHDENFNVENNETGPQTDNIENEIENVEQTNIDGNVEENVSNKDEINRNNGQVENVRRSKKLTSNIIGIERSMKIESNVPFEIIDDSEIITANSNSLKKIDIELEKKFEARRNSDQRYESFSIINNSGVAIIATKKQSDDSEPIIEAHNLNGDKNNPVSVEVESETNMNFVNPKKNGSSSENSRKNSLSQTSSKKTFDHNVSELQSVSSSSEKGSFTVIKPNVFSDLDEVASILENIESSKKRSKSIHRFQKVENENSPNEIVVQNFRNTKTITQKVQSNIRTYYVERKIFNELLELKRLQIRSGQVNEAALTKRLVDAYNKSSMATVGLGPYKSKDYSYKSFEKFLYSTLRKLNNENDNCSQLSNSRSSLESEKVKYRCSHAAHGSSEIPSLGKSNKNNEKKKYVTMEICNGVEKKVISLPAEKFDPNKRYFVTFSVKEKSRNGSAAEDKSVDKSNATEEDNANI